MINTSRAQELLAQVDAKNYNQRFVDKETKIRIKRQREAAKRRGQRLKALGVMPESHLLNFYGKPVLRKSA